MRVLRLDLGRTRVELHPFVTVVRGLRPEARARLLEVLAGLPQGNTPVGGLIEAHGVLLDLAPATLGLLDLNHPLDVVVRAGDLPTGTNGDDPSRAARKQLADAEARATVAEAAHVTPSVGTTRRCKRSPPARSRRPATSPSARRLRSTAAPAQRRRWSEPRLLATSTPPPRRCTTRSPCCRGPRRRPPRPAPAAADAASAVGVAVAALEAVNARRDATAAAIVDAARVRLAEAEADLDAIRTGAPRTEGPQEASDVLLAQRVAAQAALLALDTSDPLPVRLALEQVREGGHIELLPSDEALALAEEVHVVEAELAKYGSAGSVDPQLDHDERALAQRRVEVAEQAVAELEAVARRPTFDPADVAELEAAHLELMELRDASGKRFGAAKASRRLEEVEALEQAVLERMGLITYTEFLMGGGGAATVPADESVADRLEAARADLEKAVHQLQQREADVVGELARAELLDRRRRLRSTAGALLGHDPGDDLEGALRRHRVPGTDTGDHLNRLRHALEGAGLALAEEDVEERLLTDLARVWLHEQSETEGQRTELEQRIAAIDVKLAAAEAREAAPVLDEPLAVSAGAVEDARVALEAAEARLRRDEEAVSEVEQLRVALAEANDREAEAAGALAAAEDAVRSAASVVRSCSDGVRVAEEALSAAEATEVASAASAAEVVQRLAVATAAGAAALDAELAAAIEAAALAGAAYAEARAAVEVARGAIADAEHAGEAARVEVDTEAEDVEWYLLARLAAQRSVSYAGSVPLVLDDALAALDANAVRSVLDRLERMAATVQLIVVTEDLDTAAWAEGLGEERAQVTEAGAA